MAFQDPEAQKAYHKAYNAAAYARMHPNVKPRLGPVTRICGQCHTTFQISQARAKVPGKGQYCSKSCYDIAQTRRVTMVCEQCGASFETQPCYVKRGQMRFCSQACATPGRTRPEAERFWEKVDKRGADECWPWLGAISDKGYGLFVADTTGKPHNVPAHRYAWETVNGPMPKGKQGNHTCPLRSCVNLIHTYAGTKKENTADAMAAGTMTMLLTPERTQGEGNSHAKLTEKDVRDIRAAKYNSADTLASFYGVSPSNIRSIRNRRSWKHLE